MKYKLLNALLLTAMAAALAPAAVATTWYVDGVSGSDGNNCTSATTACKTIGHAIEAAVSADSIIVAPAIYTEGLFINKSLTILGSDATTTIVDGGGGGTVVRIPSFSGHVKFSGMTIRHGAARTGGGIQNSAVLTLSSSTVSGNSASFQGGGIWNSGLLTINRSTISGNVANGSCRTFCLILGGGLYNSGSGTVTITNSTIAGNSARNWGGGIFNGAGVTIRNSTISGNGNGISAFGDTILVNSTVSDSLLLLSGSKMRLSSSTVTGTTFLAGGSSPGKAWTRNSIFANNSGANCFNGTISSQGHNLSSDATCDFDAASDLNNVDPMLGPLQNNGGPTQTMALTSGSPAIDAGNPNGCTDNLGNLLKTDQRGRPRHDSEDTRGCDIGAYESQSD